MRVSRSRSADRARRMGSALVDRLAGSRMTQRPRVFITGGRRGIGRGIAYGIAEAGYDVVINDIVEDEATAETLAGLRERCASVAFIAGNVAEIDNVPKLADRA
jgi:3-oxoacyl-[acyl-carrier protein] reductase